MTRNVVLICLDTVRKDYFEEYAPRLQEMASVSFEQCRAASAWSTPSHASMLTGELPHRHGIHTHNRDFTCLERSETFLADIPDHTALGASANVYASSTFGFDTVFDHYSDIAPHRRFPAGMDMEKFIQDRDEEGIQRYLEFLREAIRHDHTLESQVTACSSKPTTSSGGPRPETPRRRGVYRLERGDVDGRLDRGTLLPVHELHGRPRAGPPRLRVR